MLEITLRPTLLAYQNTVTLDDRVVILDVEYRIRTNDWWIGFYDEALEPILTGRRVVGLTSLTGGNLDPRLPPGVFVALQVGEPDLVNSEGVGSDRPSLGQLGRSWRLVYYTVEDLEAFGDDVDLLDPRKVVVQ